MLYNKNENRKINEKKVLHKVKKNWVVVSVAILGLMGATGISKNGVHASSLNTNHQNDNSVNTNVNQGSKVNTLINQQSSPRALHLGSANQFAQNQHQLSQNQITKQTNVLRDRILAQVNQKSQTPQRYADHTDSNVSQHAIDYYGRAASPSASNVSVTASQVSHAASNAQQHEQIVSMARQQWRQLGKSAPVGESAPKSMNFTQFQSASNSVNSTYNQINSLFSDNTSMSNQANSASNIAWANINRYSWIDPQNLDINPHDSNYGSGTSSYGFSDESSAALALDETLRNQSAAIVGSAITSDSMDTTIGADSLNNLAAVSDDADARANTASLNALAARMNAILSNMNKCSGSASTALQQVNSAESEIIKDFSSVASNANSNASKFNYQISYTGNGNYADTQKAYPVANVSTFDEFVEAISNKDVEKINVMNNMNGWPTKNTDSAREDRMSTRPLSSQNWNYIYIPARNLCVNGLNDNNQWNTVDLASLNINMLSQLNPSYVALEEENLNLYGTSYFGPITSNTGQNTIQITKNVNYVGAQFAYDQDNTSGVFEGHIRLNCGAAYSPDGRYRHYDYDSDGLSPVPYAGEKSLNDRDPKYGDSFDLAIPNSSSLPPNYGIDTTSNQQFLQLSNNQTAVFKSDCDLQASTTNGGVIEFNSAANVYLDNDAKVTLIPRGTDGENEGYDPSGIYVAGGGNIGIGAGARLKIYPSIATDRWAQDNNDYNFAPSAIKTTYTTNIDIGRGGTLAVYYKDIGGINGRNKVTGNDISEKGRSLPDYTSSNSTYGALSLSGGTTSITAEPYSNLIVDGGDPVNATNDNGNTTWGTLVSFGTGTPGAIDAKQDSSVKLMVGGGSSAAQPITLFQAAGGTGINVDDPKRFELYCGGNYWADPDRVNPSTGHKDKHTLIASSGVGIQGHQVEYVDFPYDSIDLDDNTLHSGTVESFGQFNRITLPGGQNAFGYNPQLHTVASANENVADLFPYGESNINPNGVNLVDNSVGQGMKGKQSNIFSAAGLTGLANNKTGEYGPTGRSFWYNTSVLGLVRLPVNQAPTLNNDKPGLDISNGFAFKGVPSPYVEGVHTGSENSDNNGLSFDNSLDKDGNLTISGYSQPYSYIRINTKDNKNGQPIHVGQLYDDHTVYNDGQHVPIMPSLEGQAYDPFDSYGYDPSVKDNEGRYTKHLSGYGYNAVADSNGHWSCKIPGKIPSKTPGKTDDVSINQLVATSHTLTVAVNTDAARSISDYDDGMQTISKKGDRTSNANDFYLNQDNFPSGTYPTVLNNTPTGHQDDPTGTDDDDAKYNYGTDDNTDIEYVPDPKYDHYTLNHATDDNNAGQYFWAGRLKGIHDLANLIEDNSIYNMPLSFIIGYKTAETEGMDAKSMEADISKVIQYVNHIKSIVVTDYLPQIKKDASSANGSVADVDNTISNLNSLLDPMRTTDPYLNLKPLSSDFISPSYAEQNYNSLISDEYNSVSDIDDQLSDMLNTLNNYRININQDGAYYNRYMNLARSDARASQDADKALNINKASLYGDEGSNIVNIAESDYSPASSYDSAASYDNQLASSDSDAMWSGYSYIRTSASSNEAADFDSVAQSYTSSAQADSSEVVRDSTEVSHRDRQIGAANVYSANEDQINGIVNSLEDYVPSLASLKNLTLSGMSTDLASSLHNYFSSDYDAASDALSFLDQLSNDATSEESSDASNSNSANQDSASANSASSEVSNYYQSLSSEAQVVNRYDSMQNQLIQGVAGGTTETGTSNYDNAGYAAKFNQAQFLNSQAYQNLDSNDDSLASVDGSIASSAWVQIRTLHDLISSVHNNSPEKKTGLIEAELPKFTADLQNYSQLMLASSRPSASNSSGNDASNNANHANSVDNRYHGSLTVTVQDEDAQGDYTSRDIETVSIDEPVGTQLTIDPRQYQPDGFHTDVRSRPISVKVTRQGVQPQNVTFYYRIDHDNDSNGVQQLVSQAAMSSSAADSGQSFAASASQSNDGVIQGAPIWIDNLDGAQDASQSSVSLSAKRAPISSSNLNGSSASPSSSNGSSSSKPV